MTTASASGAPATLVDHARQATRIVGVDVARCLALLGMMATHILPGVDTSSTPFVPWHQQLAGGRSAALFALLAGVSLALVSGRQTPFRGRRLAAARVGIVLRAALIAVIGLVLGGLESHVAVILAYYGVLFLLSVPFLGLGWRPLAGLAVGWAVLAPVVSHLVRPHLTDPTYQVASIEQLVTNPAQLIVELTFTGYYPAVSWLAYVLAGLAVGRLALGSARVATMMTVFGGLLAIATWSVSWVLLHSETGRSALEGTMFDGRTAGFDAGLDIALVHGLYGNTPTSSWWWLASTAPHSSTPFDLLHTIGTGMLVLGLALLAGQRWPRVLAVVFAAGAMTLTLYSLHVVALAAGLGPDRGPALYAWHVAAAIAIGMLWRRFVGPGPLEWITTAFARSGSSAVLALADTSTRRSA